MRYRPSDSVAKGGVVGSVPVTRDTIWCDRKGNKMKNIGCYQPEDDGYVIVSIAIGICGDDGEIHVYMYILLLICVVDRLPLLSPINDFEQKMKGFVLKNSSVECASGKMIIINFNFYINDRQYFFTIVYNNRVLHCMAEPGTNSGQHSQK